MRRTTVTFLAAGCSFIFCLFTLKLQYCNLLILIEKIFQPYESIIAVIHFVEKKNQFDQFNFVK